MTNILLVILIILLLFVYFSFSRYFSRLLDALISVSTGTLQVSGSQTIIANHQLSLIKIIKVMSQTTEEIKALLVEANEKAGAIAADVTGLHAKIDALGDAPTAEEIAEIKELATNLKNSLTQVDEMTEEVPAEPTPEEGEPV